ncbi:hypothetical protein GCM10009555_005580 [Acrocarpospora macrocephala]|uniref:Leucine-binding protein domain-containing protein n=1 Tax=Acrocarpospora macrocephala TaxID=150177 RepID=A0A5M3X527_9ACTN|nr:ABC transporter substrate-binding protein [Acrocarpospora macrocephala]GES14751.1 hypothetical protein Amac_083480 [Acrocarpospora macrocephala]
MLRFGKLAIAAAAGSLVLSACGTNSDEAASGGDVIRVGILVSQTGLQAAAGKTHVASAQLGVDKVNQAGGVDVGGKKYKLELVAGDAATDPAKASAAAQTLLRDEGVKFLLGTGDTPTLLAIEPLLVKQNILWIGGSTYLAGRLEETKASTGYENTFATNPSAATAYSAGVKGALRFMPELKTAAVLWPAGSSLDPFAKMIETSFEEQGIKVVDTVRFDPATQDFSAVITRLKSKSPDIVFTGTSTPSVSAIASQAVDLGSPFKAIIAQGVTSGIGMTGDNGNPLPFPFMYLVNRGIDPNVGTPQVEQFYKDFAASNGGQEVAKDATQYASEFTSPVQLLAAAIQQAGTVDDIPAITKALAGGLKVEAPTGEAGFNATTHVLEAPIAVCRVLAGKGSCEAIETAK